MKLKRISANQFAGIRDLDVAFSDGINVICGKNESGKSTLVNLLSRALFQRVRIDGRSSGDREFRDLYFPSTYRGCNTVGDFIDGEVTVETETGIYTIKKEWSSDPRCILSMPDSVLRDQNKIDTILRKVLLYGEGVYSDILFSSQKNMDSSLQAILDASKKTDTKQELTRLVSQAFAESDGIAIDEIEHAIKKKIEELAGKHWDLDRGRPVPKAGRWVNNLGEVLKAYYTWEDTQEALKEQSKLEETVDECTAVYREAETAACCAEDEYSKFNSFKGQLELLEEYRKTAIRQKDDIKRFADALGAWPKLIEDLEKARKLQTEKTGRDYLDRYEAVKKVKEEFDGIDQNLLGMKCPTYEEIQAVKTAQDKISMLKNKLSKMNLSAVLNMLDSHTAEIRSLCTGQIIPASEGTFVITEAVQISIPGVMELQLAPADVNVADTEAQIAAQGNIVSTVLSSYQVDSLEALKELAKRISDEKIKADDIDRRLAVALGNDSFEEIEAAAKKITAPIRGKEVIFSEIQALCIKDPVDIYITRLETKVEEYSSTYGTINALEENLRQTKVELQQTKGAIEHAEGIPEEYRDIADPKEHLIQLKNRRDNAQKVKDDALSKKAASKNELERYQSIISGDPIAELEDAKQVLEEQKSLLAHWQHIAAVFDREKESLSANPMEDIAKNFSRYLNIISGGRVSSEFPEANKLNMDIYSGDRHLNYGKLSEGTKETVLLAFRLAVLEHLFPDGNGVIVLDDPLTDMDNDRAAQSCALIRECAKHHQVIFLTCREEYLDALGGNVIHFS